MKASCEFCGHELDTTALTTCRHVEGWEKNRNQGGTNALHLRKTHDRFAHVACVDLARKGLSGQETLV